MPIYEFHCKECRRDFKTLRSANKLESVTCPTCGTPKVARLLSITAQARSASDTACGLPMGGG
jgi:putative FmdB family regulatory protein